MGGKVWPASAPGGLAEQSQDQDGKEARKKLAVSLGVYVSTLLLLQYVVQTVLDHGDEPALLVLELSTWLCLLFYLWVVYIARVLLLVTTRDDNDRRRLGVRALLGVLAWIVGSVAASLVAYTAVSAVAAMLLMYPVTLCVAGILACCLQDYLRTGDSTETTIPTLASRQQEKPATTAPDESQNALLLQEKSSAKKAKLAHEQDLEAGLLISKA